MVKVITYGTYDLLHYGHIRLLERAKALGDYLIVGVTSDTFDRERGKINVQQSLMERVEAVRATGIADEIIIEEYEGQKIDDIKRLDVDIFTVGSDWRGKFDYLNAYCKVVYLDRTQGVSSTEIRSEQQVVRLGLIGESPILNKIDRESQFVNGLEAGKVFSLNDQYLSENLQAAEKQAASFQELLDESDALYVISAPSKHYAQIKEALEAGKHVLCESPITLQPQQWKELKGIAKDKKVVLMDSIKTAYSVAYYRLLLLAKGGIIGDIMSVDATCTSLVDFDPTQDSQKSLYEWNSICAWGPTALLPIFQLLGTEYSSKQIATHFLDEAKRLYQDILPLSSCRSFAEGWSRREVGRRIDYLGHQGIHLRTSPMVEDRLLRGEIRESAEQQALLLPAGWRRVALYAPLLPQSHPHRQGLLVCIR